MAGVLLLVVAALALTLGSAAIPPQTALAILLQRLPFVPITADAPAAWETIVLQVRLPRVLTAGVAGAALACAGATYQGVFRNPLADPYLLGVASGAALGAAIAIASPLGVDAYGFGWVPLLAFVGAASAVVLAYAAARIGSTVSNTTLILAGIAIASVAGAITSFILLTGGDQARAIFGFLFGSFNTANWQRLLIALPYLALGSVVVAAHARMLNVLQLDDEQAAQLGVDVGRTKIVLLAAASLVAATAVAMAGVIGFVGLIVPHAVRMLWGGDYRRLLPLAALTGAAFLIGADVVARVALRPQEVPVGIVTALVGGPCFLLLMRVRRLGGTL
ncbi:MAG: iron ABC transporter permease [Dehalococcoidia bacterium]|nr:iron ABC transporter permease [Dehalococcoidia bacterium]